jgi:L-amino acid N-acyltransferase YncA
MGTQHTARSAGAPSVVIRLATPADAATLVAIYAPYVEGTAVSFELRPPDAVEMAARIARTTERTPWLVAELGGVARGYAYAGRFRDRPAYDWSAESGIYVEASARGLGLGRALMASLIAVLRLQGFRTLVAGVTPPNPASVALHLALGFRRVGTFQGVGHKFGAWHGVEFFELALAPRPDGVAATPIRPLPELLGTPELALAIAGGTHPEPPTS